MCVCAYGTSVNTSSAQPEAEVRGKKEEEEKRRRREEGKEEKEKKI